MDVEVTVQSNIPRARGVGSSSSELRAAQKAAARAVGIKLPNEILDFLTVCAEKATNPAEGGPSVFLHRLGVGAAQAAAWPKLRILAFDDPNSADVVTNAYQPAVYSKSQIDDFGLLVRAAMAACRRRDALGLGKIATISAEINDAFLPRRGAGSIESLLQIRNASRAAGFAVSHSGSVGALLYGCGSVDLDSQIQLAREMLTERGCAVLCVYDLG